VSRIPTRDRAPLSAAQLAAVDYPASAIEYDNVHLTDVAGYVQATSYWFPWMRSVLGVRVEHIHGSDAGTNPGTAQQTVLLPKVNLIFTPVDTTEIYLSYGEGFHSDDLRGFNQSVDSNTPGAPLLAKQTGEELGLRQQFGRNVALTVALFNLEARSETTYNADIGQDNAGPGSKRYGVEVNVTYQALRWLEFYGSVSANHARFTSPFDDGTGHVGEYLQNASTSAGSLNVYVKNLGPWHGGLALRYVGPFPLSSDNAIRGPGYKEVNGDLGYSAGGGWDFSLDLFNILNEHAYGAEFWYPDRLPGEPAEGVADKHVHPMEPFSLRFSVSKRF
jgi:outer membrane receptor protein involved in Fe transport